MRSTRRAERRRRGARTCWRGEQSLLATARSQTPIHPVWLTTCLNEVKAPDAIVVNELGLHVAHLDLGRHGSYIGGNMSGGLGFGLGAALGAKLAAPEREVITVVGDGSYMFGNPLLLSLRRPRREAFPP